ncbi:MerR family DNA-binding transcriptional regulator [Dechloromonas sp. ZS-1]|uniref:MerR family transcriptional regulator n=1 Tax=Dechloromonas sp. ZS-1 TaxID=3138067 RepID=UPI0031FC6DB3
MSQTASTFAISDLAREFGITPRTIRFWEDQGILAPEREGNKRVFTRRDRARLKMALRGKRLGLSLAEIKDLIGMYNSTEDETPQLLECLRIMEKRRAALVQQREDIEAMLAEIGQFESQCQQELVRRQEA